MQDVAGWAGNERQALTSDTDSQHLTRQHNRLSDTHYDPAADQTRRSIGFRGDCVTAQGQIPDRLAGEATGLGRVSQLR